MSIRTSASVFLWIVALGCEGNSETSNSDAGFDPCNEISIACHLSDPGSGPIHDCHELAHQPGEGQAGYDACAAAYDSCIALCRIDSGASHDGGAEHHH